LHDVEAALDGPSGSVFRGSEFAIRLRISGAEDAPVGVSAEVLSGPMQLVEVVEDEVQSTDGPQRDLTWILRATGAGTLELGPFHVVAGSRTTRVDGLRIEAKAPPGKERADAPAPSRLLTPREIVGDLKAPAAVRRDEALHVVLSPTQRLHMTPSMPDNVVRYELRRAGEPQWALWACPEAAMTQVRITERGKLLLDVNL
jgi:hypothetical protein